MPREAVRVLLVDDQELIRTGLGLILAPCAEISVVGEAAEGEQALAALAETPADVALMDVRMPGMDGIEATARIVREFPETKVVLLTTFDEEALARAGFAAGADGFLLKDAPQEELVRAILTVADGGAFADPGLAKRLLDDFRTNLAGERPAVGAALEQLTPREWEVFVLVARGLSNAEIAGRLELSPVTVRTHVDHISCKLGLEHRAQIIVYAYEQHVIVPMRTQRDA